VLTYLIIATLTILAALGWWAAIVREKLLRTAEAKIVELREELDNKVVTVRVRPHTPETLAELPLEDPEGSFVVDSQFARSNMPNSTSKME
jgi:hypothetical protein